MPKLYNDLGQKEYDRIATEYFETVGHDPNGTIYLHFFAYMQTTLENRIRDKFDQLGYIFELDPAASERHGQRMWRCKPKDVFKALPSKPLLNMTGLIKELRLVNWQIMDIPDVKIVIPEYAEEKMQEIEDKVIKNFADMVESARPNTTPTPPNQWAQQPINK